MHHLVTYMVVRDVEKGGLSWEEVVSLTADRREWRNWIAQCAHHKEDLGLRLR